MDLGAAGTALGHEYRRPALNADLNVLRHVAEGLCVAQSCVWRST